MEHRTRTQETKYNQALGYGWGAKDIASKMSPLRIRTMCLTADVLSFATFYATYEEKVGTHITLESAWRYFIQLRLDEQKAYGSEWATLPYMEMTTNG